MTFNSYLIDFHQFLYFIVVLVNLSLIQISRNNTIILKILFIIYVKYNKRKKTNILRRFNLTSFELNLAFSLNKLNLSKASSSWNLSNRKVINKFIFFDNFSSFMVIFYFYNDFSSFSSLALLVASLMNLLPTQARCSEFELVFIQNWLES